MKNLFNIILVLLIQINSLSISAQEDIVPINKDSRLFDAIVYSNSSVDESPKFPGGEKEMLKFYRDNSPYQISAKEREGLTVYYRLVIDEKGKIYDFKILRGQDEELNQLTEEIVKKMPKWKPGKKEGKKVKVMRLFGITYIRK